MGNTSVTTSIKNIKSIATKYSVEELANNSEKVFGVKRECVVAALKLKQVHEATVEDAKKIVESFMKKEVK